MKYGVFPALCAHVCLYAHHYGSVAHGRGMLTLWSCRMKEKASPLLLSTPEYSYGQTDRPTYSLIRISHTRILQYKQRCFTFLKGGRGERPSPESTCYSATTTWAFCVKRKGEKRWRSFFRFFFPPGKRTCVRRIGSSDGKSNECPRRIKGEGGGEAEKRKNCEMLRGGGISLAKSLPHFFV